MKEDLAISAALLGQLYRIVGSHAIGKRPHTHEELEMNLVTGGQAGYLVDGCKLTLEQGSLLWLYPSQEHALTHASGDFAMWVFVFRPGLVERACRTGYYQAMLANEPVGPTSVRLQPNAYRGLLRMCEDAAACLQQDDDIFNAALRYLMLKAWRAMGETGSLPSASSDLHHGVFKAAMVLHQRPDLRSLSDLAKEVGVSFEHLSRLFKTQMGRTLSEYRNEQRFRRAEELIREGKLNLLEATLEAGFGSYSQFFRLLKARSGKSPSELVAELKGSANGHLD